MDNRPIGVFDSGLGGLTAVRSLRQLLPGENLIYFGDTARVPYGGRSKETLLKYARQDVRFLRSFDLKAVVVACGTVSTTSLDTLRAENDLPIVPDVGMFASFDPVALDLACADAVNAQVINPGSKLDKANRPDLDNLTGSFPHTNWRSQIAHAKKIGLGEDCYELVTI